MSAPFPEELEEAFEPVKVLGEGGMGVVWQARDRRLDRQVAVKCMLRPDDAGLVQRFEREAAMLAAIEHPGVLRLYTHGRTADGVYLVTELLEGCPLSEVEDRTQAVSALVDVAAALQELHSRGLMHRDVKPENIFVTRDGRGVLMDFGLAHDPGKTRLTATGQLIGTLVFMAPELLQGVEPTPAADWYGWSATLFEKLEGRPPYEFDALMDWASRGQELPDIEFEHVPEDHPLEKVLTDLLDPDPKYREEASRGAREAVQKWLAGVDAPGKDGFDGASTGKMTAVRNWSSDSGKAHLRRSGGRRRSSGARRRRSGERKVEKAPTSGSKSTEELSRRRRRPFWLMAVPGLVVLAALVGLLLPSGDRPVEEPTGEARPVGPSADPSDYDRRFEELVRTHSEPGKVACVDGLIPNTHEHGRTVQREMADRRLPTRVAKTLEAFDAWRKKLTAADWRHPAVRRRTWCLLRGALPHIDSDVSFFTDNLQDFEKATPELLKAMTRARRNRSEIEEKLTDWTERLLAEQGAPPYLWVAAAGVVKLLPTNVEARMGSQLLELFRDAAGDLRQELGAATLRVHQRLVRRDSDLCERVEEVNYEVSRALTDVHVEEFMVESIQLLRALGERCEPVALREGYEYLRPHLVEYPADRRLRQHALSDLRWVQERLQDQEDARRSGEQVRKLQALWWWTEGRFQLLYEGTAHPARGAEPEHAGELVPALGAAEAALEGGDPEKVHRATMALFRPVLASLNSGVFSRSTSSLAHLAELAPRLSGRLRRERERLPELWRKHVTQVNGFVWRVLRPLEDPQPERFVLAVAFSREVPFVGDRFLYGRAYQMDREGLPADLVKLVSAAQSGVEDQKLPWRQLFLEHGGLEGVRPEACDLWRGATFAGRKGSISTGINPLLENFNMYLAEHVADALQCLRWCGDPAMCPVGGEELLRDLAQLNRTREKILTDRLRRMCPEVEIAYAGYRGGKHQEFTEPLLKEFRRACAGLAGK